MADISKIKLPSGSSYDLKDSTARSSLSSITNGSMTSTKGVATYVTDYTRTAAIKVAAGTTVRITAVVDCETDTIAKALLSGVAGSSTYNKLGVLYNGTTVVAKVSDFNFALSGRLIVGTYSYTNSSKSAVTLTDKSKSYNDTLYTLFKSVCSKDHFIVTSVNYAVETLETATVNQVTKLVSLVNSLSEKVATQGALLKNYADRVNALEKRNYGFAPMVMPVLDSSLKITDEKEICSAVSEGSYYSSYHFFTPNASLDKHGNIYSQSEETDSPYFLVSDFISSPDERFDYFIRFDSTPFEGEGVLDRMQKGINLAVYDKNENFLWGCPLAMPKWIALIPRDCKVRVAFGSNSSYIYSVNIYTGTKIDYTSKS